MAPDWSNWSGSVQCRPLRLARPRSEEDLAREIRRAAGDGLSVRAVGRGHSSSRLVATDGVIISLDALAGIESIDSERLEATVRAGTSLHDLSAALRVRRLALANLGDVDVQSLAGALATGTHGTGRTLANLSSHVRAIRIVTAAGDVREIDGDREPDLLRAARVSLGALGVISSVRIGLVPAFRLHERVRRVGVDACLESLDESLASHRHFEFFWWPRMDEIETKTLDPTDERPESVAGREGERIGWSGEILPSVRELRFHEMEYAVPAAQGPACLQTIRARIQERHPRLSWPVEYRTVAPDDADLSRAHDRETVAISIHQDGRRPYAEIFSDLESVFRDCGGRPHWGKIHTRSGADLAPLYPRWEDFRRVREAFDPEGRFLNAHLRSLFEP